MPYMIGSTLGGMVTLASLGVPDPKSTWQPYSELVPLDSGKERGVGFPVATWQFGYLTRAQRNALRTFCTGASAAVYIQTRKADNDDAYDDYSAIMVWPLAEDRDAGRRISFVIRFKHLVEA
jgi:hypothetical protein